MAEPRSSQVRLSNDRTALREPIPAEVSTQTDPLENDLTVISGRGPLPDRGEGALLKPLEVGKMLEGERLGQFVLQRYVGGGGMGVVFKALDTTLNREVAVKVLAHSQAHDEETLKRFQNEAQSAARLDHENIARVYYVGVDRGVHYIVFEFIEGINLRDLVQRDGPLPLADAISFTLQVAEALAHASQRDVIHRDIKPSNVIVTPEGKAKLVDMGLARLHQVEHPDNDLTASGVTLGTFDYISPEQARDPRSADVRSDIYSLGCSFYFMLTGRPPFPEGTVLQKLLQHQAEDPVDPRQFRSDMPKAMGAILAKMLAKNPDRRYQTPMELIEDLGALVTEGSTPRAVLDLGYARPLRPAAPSTWRRHLPWLVPLAVLALFLVLHEYYYWTPPEASPVASSMRSATQPRREQPASTLPALSNFENQPPAKTNAAPVVDGSATAGPVTGTWNEQLRLLRNNMERLPDWWRRISGGNQAAPAADPAFDPPAQPGAPNGLGLTDPVTLSPSMPAPTTSPGSLGLGLGGLDASRPAPAAPSATATSATGAVPVPVPGEKGISEKGVLIVAPDRKGEGIFGSLPQAIAAAKDGEVIELDFSGRLEQKPLMIANTHISLRAAKGRRPILVFRPADAAAVGYSRSMLTVAGGSLAASGIEIELEVPRRISGDAWALIEIRRAERLRFERTTLTIRNPGASPRANLAAVAFFDVKTPLGSDTMGISNMPMSVPQIELADCIVRGEATFLRDSDFEPAHLSWSNGLLAISDFLLDAQATPGRTRAASSVKIELNRVTALVRSGLVRVANSEDAPSVLDANLDCRNSVIVIDPVNPLIEQHGTESQFQDHFQWNGENVDFEGVETFWRIVRTPIGEPTDWDFAKWDDFWRPRHEMGCRRGAMPWLAEAAVKKRLSDLSPADLGAPRGGDAETAPLELGGDSDKLPIPSLADVPAGTAAEPPPPR